MAAPNRRKLVAQVVERTGLKLDEDDPAFVLVELNQLVLEEAASNVEQKLQAAGDKFASTATKQADDFVALANDTLGQFKRATLELKEALGRAAAMPATPQTPARSEGAPAAGSGPSHAPASSMHWWFVPLSFILGALVGVVAMVFLGHAPS